MSAPNVREVPGYRREATPFGGINDPGLGYNEALDAQRRSHPQR